MMRQAAVLIILLLEGMLVSAIFASVDVSVGRVAAAEMWR